MNSHQEVEVLTKALYLGRSFKLFLSDPLLKKDLRVHSVFHSVINLKSEEGLLSIVTPKIGKLATYAVIPKFENEDFLTMNIDQHTKCTVKDGNFIFCEKLCIDFKNAIEWRGILDEGYKWELKEIKEDRLQALKAALNIYAAKNSAFKRIYEIKENNLITAIGKLNLKNSQDLISSAIFNLIGFGPGLTPTGDDFITGFLSVVASCSENIYSKKFFIKSIYENINRTNYVSGNMLSNSTKEIFHEYIQELIYAVGCETPERVIICTKKLISIGATSGSDIATGIYIGFKNVLEYFKKL